MNETALKKGIKPSILFYVLAGLVILAGIVLSGVILLNSFTDTGEKVNFTMPGESVIELKKDGNQNIYYEYRFSNKLNEDITFTFENADTGEIINSKYANYSSHYSVNGQNGILVASVLISEPGMYIVSSDYAGQEQLTFATGNFVSNMVFNILKAVAVFLLFSAIGITTIIVVSIKRQKAKSRA